LITSNAGFARILRELTLAQRIVKRDADKQRAIADGDTPRKPTNRKKRRAGDAPPQAKPKAR
jgi:hypothetical protein